ncbi:GNAT family N-acetyltransferase [Jatrophihabitans fulvus]
MENLTLDRLGDVARVDGRCHACSFWQTTPADSLSDSVDAKSGWVSETLREWGSCGQILYVDGDPVGHALYAPAAYVPRAEAFATAPASPDSVLLTTVRVRDDLVGHGFGRMLVQGVARDTLRRGIRAIEVFGRHGPAAVSSGCLLPSDFLLAVGFRTVRPHLATPRLRMDLRSVATWREDVEHAVARVLKKRASPAPSG